MTEYIEIIRLLEKAIGWCDADKDKEELKNALTDVLKMTVKALSESLEN